jgi:nitroreductase
MAEPSPATTLTMSLEEAMRTQRAIRRLKPDPVDDALVLHLIELALRAPTGSNAQNWQFVVVRDRDVKARLGKLNRQAWRLYGGIGRRMAANDPPMMRIIEAVQWQVDHFEDIPVLVVACLATMIPVLPRIAVSSLYGSIFPSVQNLLLAARAVLPWSVTPCAVIPLGWPRGRYGPTTRKPVGEVVHLDRWGNQPFRA